VAANERMPFDWLAAGWLPDLARLLGARDLATGRRAVAARVRHLDAQGSVAAGREAAAEAERRVRGQASSGCWSRQTSTEVGERCDPAAGRMGGPGGGPARDGIVDDGRDDPRPSLDCAIQRAGAGGRMGARRQRRELRQRMRSEEEPRSEHAPGRERIRLDGRLERVLGAADADGGDVGCGAAHVRQGGGGDDGGDGTRAARSSSGAASRVQRQDASSSGPMAVGALPKGIWPAAAVAQTFHSAAHMRPICLGRGAEDEAATATHAPQGGGAASWSLVCTTARRLPPSLPPHASPTGSEAREPLVDAAAHRLPTRLRQPAPRPLPLLPASALARWWMKGRRSSTLPRRPCTRRHARPQDSTRRSRRREG